MLEKHYTPQEAAELLACDVEQVLSFINSDELVAVNVAKQAHGKRPRWRISESHVGKFLLHRRHPASAPQPPQRATKRPEVKQYV